MKIDYLRFAFYSGIMGITSCNAYLVYSNIDSGETTLSNALFIMGGIMMGVAYSFRKDRREREERDFFGESQLEKKLD